MEAPKHCPLPWGLDSPGFIRDKRKGGVALVSVSAGNEEQRVEVGHFILHAVNSIAKVTAERDALLGALKNVRSLIMDCASDGFVDKEKLMKLFESNGVSSKAIASVEGGAK